MIRDSVGWSASGSGAGPGGRAFICEIRPLTNTLSNLGNDLQQVGVGVDAVTTVLQQLKSHGFGAPVRWPFDPAAAGSQNELKRPPTKIIELLWGAPSITTANTGTPSSLRSLLG